MENAEWVAVMTTLSPAPEAVIELVKCGCSKERYSTNRCQCRRAGYCARTCVAVLTTVNARTSMATTNINMMRTKVMKTSVVMNEGLRNDSKNVYVSLSGILKKTINFHETLPQESEFLSKCRHYWRIKFGLFFMSASCCL